MDPGLRNNRGDKNKQGEERYTRLTIDTSAGRPKDGNLIGPLYESEAAIGESRKS